MNHIAKTSLGEIEYTLIKKRVKNINLRVKAGGAVQVSAPLKVGKKEVESFIQQKAAWILKYKAQAEKQQPRQPCQYTKEQCLAVFTSISDRIFPLFSDLLQGQKPTIRVRDMTSRWGSCNYKNRIITLNMRLMEKPFAAIEYVVLHEYVHFLHQNHQAGFHGEMARLMPDYKQRRRLLAI